MKKKLTYAIFLVILCAGIMISPAIKANIIDIGRNNPSSTACCYNGSIVSYSSDCNAGGSQCSDNNCPANSTEEDDFACH